MSVSLFSQAYAQEDPIPVSEGWVYFGYQKNPRLWNFSFEEGDFNSMLSGEKTILRSKKHLNIRNDHFGDFTGTFLGFIDPPPAITGDLKVDECIFVKSTESVGFSKIWVNFEKVKCKPEEEN